MLQPVSMGSKAKIATLGSWWVLVMRSLPVWRNSVTFPRERASAIALLVLAICDTFSVLASIVSTVKMTVGRGRDVWSGENGIC